MISTVASVNPIRRVPSATLLRKTSARCSTTSLVSAFPWVREGLLPSLARREPRKTALEPLRDLFRLTTYDDEGWLIADTLSRMAS
jgi:hypothetical protein